MKKRLAVGLIGIMLAIAGCGSDASPGADSADVQEKSVTTDNAMNDTKQQSEASEIAEEKQSPKEEKDETATEPSEDSAAAKSSDNNEASLSLARRLCGKYSYHASSENGEDLYYIVNTVSFGDNLYAYCGE